MPKNLTDDPASFPTQTAPLPSEPRTAGGIEASLQHAANRAGYLRDRLIYLDPDKGGVRRQRRFASVADMKASVDFPDKSVALIDGVGFYQFDAASVVAEASPAIITPTSVGVGAGRWLAAWFGSFNVANGVPQLDGSGKVPTSLLAAAAGGAKIDGGSIANGTLGIYTSGYALHSTTSAVYVDVPTIAAAFDLLAGDRVTLFGQAGIYQEDLAADYHWTRIAVTKPDTSVVGIGELAFKQDPAAGDQGGLPIGAYYQATADGIHTFRIQHHGGASGATMTLQNIMLTATAVRP